MYASKDITVQGSRIAAEGDISLYAERDINLVSATNQSTVSGSNSSSGASIGVSVTVGAASGVGVGVSANISKGKGRENGTTVTHEETLVQAGKTLTTVSGRDTNLIGAQAGGARVEMDVGRNLTLQSQQDIDNYNSKQSNSNASVSYSPGGPLGIGGGASQQKMDSDYASVQEQTGIYAGKGGFDIRVEGNTSLEGAVIASEAPAEKNQLDTGTLSFKNIENKAEFQVEGSGISGSTGGSIGDLFLGNMAGAVLNNANNEGDAASTTQSAVAPGEIRIRDTEHQEQDVAELSRDTDQANAVLDPIFDKEKEQARLDEQKAISEIGNQLQDVLRTEGQIRAEQAKKDPEALAQAELELRAEGKEPSAQEILDRAGQNAMRDWGTGGVYQQLSQALIGALNGLSAEDWAKALSGAGAPYLASLVKDLAGDNEELRYAGHAVLGGILAYLNGTNAASGALGAVTGEALAQYLLEAYYPGKKAEDLTEDEKQRLSGLSTLAAGVVGGMVGSGFADAIAGAQTGQNAVENNQYSTTNLLREAAVWKNSQNLLSKKWTDEERNEALNTLMIATIPLGSGVVVGTVRLAFWAGGKYYEYQLSKSNEEFIINQLIDALAPKVVSKTAGTVFNDLKTSIISAVKQGDIAKANEKITTLQANRLKGSAFEKSVLDSLGVDKNTKKVVGALDGGNFYSTIPDGLTSDKMFEVKNWQNLSYVQQLRAQIDYAQKNSLEYELIVNKNTTLNAPLIQALKDANATVKQFDSVTKKMEEVKDLNSLLKKSN